jgi:hypothetical protein
MKDISEVVNHHEISRIYSGPLKLDWILAGEQKGERYFRALVSKKKYAVAG